MSATLVERLFDTGGLLRETGLATWEGRACFGARERGFDEAPFPGWLEQLRCAVENAAGHPMTQCLALRPCVAPVTANHLLRGNRLAPGTRIAIVCADGEQTVRVGGASHLLTPGAMLLVHQDARVTWVSVPRDRRPPLGFTFRYVLCESSRAAVEGRLDRE